MSEPSTREVSRYLLTAFLVTLGGFFVVVAGELFLIRPVLGISAGASVALRVAGLAVGPALLLAHHGRGEPA